MTRILLVDDCKLTVSALNRALTAAGYHVWATCSSQAGIEALQRERPDLVITDINMPTPDGIDLL
jgi:CheY-like chemotaxis protein